MKISLPFGLVFDVSRSGVERATTLVGPTVVAGDLTTVERGSWFPVVGEAFTGAWQRNISYRKESLLSYSAVYACITKIATDVSKMRMMLMSWSEEDGIWSEIESSAFSPVLRRPNRTQNRIQFLIQWIVSKLSHGNTYVLKGRDNRGVVTDLYILNPQRVKPLVTEDGDVYYQLSPDNLSGLKEDVIVPASEIIHDVMIPLYHPLVGVSPLYACGMAASQGLSIQASSKNFFENGSRPGSILTAPGSIDDVTANRVKREFEERFGGVNAGRVAVLGNGLTYAAMGMSASDSQLIDQLKWSAETVCSCFQMPPYLIGIGSAPPYTNIEALGQQYYSQCLQGYIEAIELCLSEGLGMDELQGRYYAVQLETDVLFRMDTETKIKSTVEGLKGIFSPNEGRRKFNLPPKDGGDSVYLQQQNFSLEALNKRDASDDPFKSANNGNGGGSSGGGTPNPDLTAGSKTFDYDEESSNQLTAWRLEAAFAQLRAAREIELR